MLHGYINKDSRTLIKFNKSHSFIHTSSNVIPLIFILLPCCIKALLINEFLLEIIFYSQEDSKAYLFINI